MSSISWVEAQLNAVDVFFRHQRIVQLVVLVIELDDRARQRRALFHAEALCDRARRNVAAHDFQRNDLNLANELLAHVHSLDEMRRRPNRVEVGHDERRNLIIQNAFAVQDRFLGAVKSRRVVFEMLNDGARLGSLVKNLGLAFIDFLATRHRALPPNAAITARGRRGRRSISLMTAHLGRIGVFGEESAVRQPLQLSDPAAPPQCLAAFGGEAFAWAISAR